ncbi:MAG: TonB-dependent receptor [Bryobacterales bacterium]|nr:TonB-dependent receptor [Bryobacterales bacterium]
MLRLLFCTLAVAFSLFAQNAQIRGVISDPSGLIVPGANISIANTATGVVRDAVSNDQGIYRIPLLQPGKYTMQISKDGFKSVQQKDIVLQIDDLVTLNVNLEVGTQSQSVSVVAETPLLRTDDAQTGLVIDNKRIQELPQYNRNALAFAQLAPNVNGTADQQGYSTDFRINGGRTAKAEYIIDGVAVTTGFRHDVPPSVPSMEAVGEFKVITNGLSAEYGRLSGGAVTLVTRSGTNAFHGSAYEFFRNDKLNSNDWNSNRFGRTKGVFHDNVFGGAIGGPVRIPKLYNGKDRTFFFLNYEGTRRRTGSNAQLASVPSDLEREGDFSQSLIDTGRPVQISDPLTSRAESGRVVRSPFPGNRLPASRIDPLSKIYMGFYPKANTAPRPNSSHDQNFIGSASTPLDNNRWTGRLDENWSSKHNSHFTITQFSEFSAGVRWLSALQPVTTNDTRAFTMAFDHNYLISPNTIFNMRLGAVRSVAFSGAQVDADAAAWNLAPEVVNLLGTTKNRVPALGTADTITGIGGGSVTDNRDTIYSGQFSVQKLMGRHTLKFGYEHRRYYSNIYSGGSFSTASIRSATSQYFDAPNNGQGSGLASWMLGVVGGGSGTQLAGPASLQPYHGLFIQDDFKVAKNLTINAGLRWDYESPRTERFDRQTFWDRDYKWPVNAASGWNWNSALNQAQAVGSSAPTPAWTQNGIYGRVALMNTPEYPGRTMQQKQFDRFGPRVGVAWSVAPKTVIRGGYGMIWMTLTGSFHLNGSPWNIGYGDAARLIQGGTPDGGLTFPLSFSNPMPGGAGLVRLTRDIDALNRSVMGNWFVSSATNIAPGYEHVFHFGVQREVGSGWNSWLLEANYTGNLGRSLPYYLGNGEHILQDAYHKIGPLGLKLNNQVQNPYAGFIPQFTGMGSATIPFGRLFQNNPLWTEIWTLGEPIGRSNYHAGYVQAEHRFSKGYGFLINYTFSKLLNDVGSYDGSFSMPYPQAGLPVSSTYGIATTDITHKLLFNYSVDLPFGRGRRFLGNPDNFAANVVDHAVGGWTMAGTTTIRGGVPVTVRTPSNTVGGLGSNWYNIGHGRDSQPVMVPGVAYNNNVSGHTALEGAGGFRPYFNPDAFRVVRDFEIGDAPSTMPNFRGPGFSQWDLSLLKSFRLFSDSKSLQLRMEAQNLFNKMNPGNPGNAILSRTFGVITGQQGSPRRIMVAAKFYF